jgi:radical SAM protein with 4Fe4S-binding SPASM domain
MVGWPKSEVEERLPEQEAINISALIVSPFLRLVRGEKSAYTFAYHTLFGSPRVLNDECVRFLNLFREGISATKLRDFVEGDSHELLDDLLIAHFLVPRSLHERVIVRTRQRELLGRVATGQTVDHISLSVSENCNFGCRHCMFYQSDNKGTPLPIYQKPVRALIMDWPTAKECVDKYVHLLVSRGESHGRIHFGNAEPLLNWNVIAAVLEYCSQLTGLTFDFAINTNLSLLTREMGQALKRYKVKVATSLDGLGEANDAIRTTKSGKGTFGTILAKMELLEDMGYPLDGVSITVTEKNFHAVDSEIIDFAARRGMTSVAFDYDLVNFSSVSVADRIEKIVRLKNYANSCGIYFGGTWYSPFRKLMTTSLLDRPHAFCAAVEGRALVFNPDGTLKTCGYTTTVVGHMHLGDVFGEEGGLYQLVRERFPGTDAYCQGCGIEGPCGGQCHATREVARRDSMDLFEQMCVFYRSVTDALIQDYLEATDNPQETEQRTRYL